MSLYKVFRGLASVVYHLLFRIKIVGIENIPDGPCVVCANHKSNFDPPLLAVCLPVPVRFMAKEELFKNKLFGKILLSFGAFPVKRGKGDVGALRSAIKMLESGEKVAIFPEGTRSKKDYLKKGKKGAVLIAVKAGVNIIPVGISGGYRLFEKMTVTIGKEISLDEYFENDATTEDFQEITDTKIMPEIAALAGVKTYENRNS